MDEFTEPSIQIEGTRMTLGATATEALVRECRADLQRSASRALQLCEKVPDKQVPATQNNAIGYNELRDLGRLGGTIEACAEVLMAAGDHADDGDNDPSY
jgi:hypothetical protein